MSAAENGARRAGEWLARHLPVHLGDPLHGSPALRFRRLKAVCEIGFLEEAAGADPAGAAGPGSALDPVLARLRSHGRLLRLTLGNPAHANLFLPLLLAAWGRDRAEPGAATARVLGATVEWLSTRTRERLPFRRLDLLHAVHLATGHEAPLAELDRAAAHGCLGPRTDVSRVDPGDEYAVTHTVLYVTDFGRRSWPPGLADPAVVLDVLDLLSHDADATDNLDLLGEYAWCRACLGARSGRFHREIERLLEAQRDDGSVPGPVDLGPALERDGVPEEDRPFFTDYHTTLVARFALRAAEEPGTGGGGRPPSARWSPRHPGETLRSPPRRGGDEEAAAMEELATSYRELLRGRVRPPGPEAFTRPSTTLPALEWVAAARVAGHGVETHRRLCRELLAAGPRDARDFPRVLRYRATAGVALGGTAPVVREVALALDGTLDRRIEAAWDPEDLEGDGVDLVVARALLLRAAGSGGAGPSASARMRGDLLRLVRADNPLVAARVLPWARPFLRPELGDHLARWLRRHPLLLAEAGDALAWPRGLRSVAARSRLARALLRVLEPHTSRPGRNSRRRVPG